MTDDDRTPEGPDTGGEQPGEAGNFYGRSGASWQPHGQAGDAGQPYEQPGDAVQSHGQSGVPGQPYGLGRTPGYMSGLSADQGGYSADQGGYSEAPRYYPTGAGYPHQQDQNTQQFVSPAYPTPPPVAESGKQRRVSGKLIALCTLLALVVGGAAGGVGGYFAGRGAGDDASGTSLESVPAKDHSDAPKGSTEDTVNTVMPSVVQVKVPTPRGVASGSGFAISEDGYIMTNNHVVAPAEKGGSKIVVQLSKGDKAEAKVVGRDPTTDIAVIKADDVDDLQPAELGRSANLKVGQSVLAIGSPFRLSGTVTQGIVSAMHRPVRSGGEEGKLETVMDAIQTDAAINPGNSGGPLVNTNGEVIGINSAIYSPGAGASSDSSGGGNVGIGFAIPIDQARRTANEIINDGHATETYMGATVRNADKEGGGGAYIADVTGKPAEKAGLEHGDVVVKIDDRTTDTIDALIAAIRTKAPGTKVALTLDDGSTVDVKLGGKPIDAN